MFQQFGPEDRVNSHLAWACSPPAQIPLDRPCMLGCCCGYDQILRGGRLAAGLRRVYSVRLWFSHCTLRCCLFLSRQRSRLVTRRWYQSREASLWALPVARQESQYSLRLGLGRRLGL